MRRIPATRKLPTCDVCAMLANNQMKVAHEDNNWIYFDREPYYNMPMVVLKAHRVFSAAEISPAVLMAQRLWGLGMAMEMNGYDPGSNTFFPHGFFYYSPSKSRIGKDYQQILESVL